MPDGSLVVTRVPTGASAVWWVATRREARAIAKLVDEDQLPVQAAAQELNIAVTPHTRVLERAGAAVARIEVALRQAQADGVLKIFNRSYREHRQAAAAEGRHYMSYTTARTRLMGELFKAATGEVAPGIIARVFARR